MAKINSLRDIIQFNSNFKTAINLYLSLNKAEKVLGYIPTKSSVSFLGEYLKAVLENKEQATLLVGPYGKGKSHLLLVLLAVLSMKKTPESESAINELIDNVSKTDEVGERVSEYIGQVWDKKRFLPVLITDTTGDLNQAFLYGLNDALKRDGLLDLAPETYYSIALDRIDDWEQNYFETYKMFERELTQNGMSIAELKTDLKQYSQKTLILFKEIYPKVTAGSEFNPMALADGKVITLYSFSRIKQEAVKQHLLELAEKRLVVICPKKGLKAKKQLKDYEIISDLKGNQVFTNNNEILKRELPLLLDDLTTELEIIIGDVYEDDLDTKVLYFDGGRIKNAKSGNVEKAVNECCLNVYTSTPIINNEMVNRAEIGTAQTKKARLNIVQAILSHTDTPEFYRGSNQEATIYRSLFCVTGIVDGDIREDIQLMNMKKS